MQIIPVFDAASPQAKAIVGLFTAVLIICGAIMAVVVGALAYSMFRFRHRPDSGEPRQVFGNRQLEILWTVVPICLLVWIFVLTVRAISATGPAANREPDLIVIGHQWWWEARYPKSGAVTANEIHIPVGQPLLLRVESVDVIHDFWPPRLSRKIDMIPGHPNEIWLQADRADTYLGACAEYCGDQHARMRFVVIAEPADTFAAWEARQAQPAAAPATDQEKRGQKLFLQKTCVNCHAIRGVSPAVAIAPDLTHLASRRALAAELLPNTPADLARWLKNPDAIKPGSRMPNLKLADAQVNDLVSYFATLK